MNRREYNWLSRMQDTEFLGANSFMQESRNRLGQAIASGNGQFLTMEMALNVRWGNSLLEDFEFTVRGLFQNYRAIFLPSAIVCNPGCDNLTDFDDCCNLERFYHDWRPWIGDFFNDPS
jgi:cellulose synthase/poly-beta-1,6-N-acetylglucosamine synthase-like glycosyltransferase